MELRELHTRGRVSPSPYSAMELGRETSQDGYSGDLLTTCSAFPKTCFVFSQDLVDGIGGLDSVDDDSVKRTLRARGGG